MNRCDYCCYKNMWDCEDEFARVGNKVICEDFKLEFECLSDKQKKQIQKILMHQDHERIIDE